MIIALSRWVPIRPHSLASRKTEIPQPDAPGEEDLSMMSESYKEQYRCMGSWRCSWGGCSLEEAHGICLDAGGELIVSDSRGGKVVRFSREAEYLGEVSEDPEVEAFFKGPRDVRVDGEGRIVILDGDRCRLSVHDPDGSYLWSWGKPGSGPGQMLRPHSLDLFEDMVYVVDVDNSRVNVHNIDGTFDRSWGQRGTGPGEFLDPHGIACDPNGDIFVAEYEGRCQKFDSRDQPVLSFANPSPPGTNTHGYMRYHAMTSDTEGDIYLLARDTRRGYASSIDKYTNDGVQVARIEFGPEDGLVIGAQAAVDGDGVIFVGDTDRKTPGVSIFEPI